MVDAGGVAIDRGSGLGAKVTVAGVEVEGADVVGAMGAGELHASFDAGDGVEALHEIQCSLFAREGKARGVGSEGNQWTAGEASEMGRALYREAGLPGAKESLRGREARC